MPRGRRSRTLTPDQIARLETFRRSSHQDRPHGYTYPELFMSLRPSGGWGFSFDTFMRAMAGKPVWEASHAQIAQWIDRYLPAADSAPQIDAKSRAAGEKDNHGS